MLQSNGKSLDETKLKKITAGGEGTIYEYGSKVLKVYHTPRESSFTVHLAILSKLDSRFVKPGQVWYNQRGLVAGFEMDYVDLNKYWLFNNLFNKGFCTSNGIDKKFKIKVIKNLKDAVEFAHSQEVIIGDLNPYNIFVKKDGSVLFCDVDSFATTKRPHSGVLLDEIRDWTTTSITKNTDIWAYDILSFWAITHCHPFKYVAQGNTETLEQRVRQGKSILSKVSGIKIPPLYEKPDAVVLPQFEEIFKGRRYFVNFDGVQLTNLVINRQISSTSLNIRELYDGIKKVRGTSTLCAVLTDKWFLLETKYPKITSMKKEIDCDELFPGKTNYIYLKNHTLYDSKDMKVRSFSNYYYHYNDGYLTIVDYNQDNQYTYKIDNQLSGVEHTVTPVFAKSILFNGCPVQNFGSKKFLNVPVLGNNLLFLTSPGTKTAIYNNEYAVIETVDKGKIEFILFQAHVYKYEPRVKLDYLPHFCVKGDILFIPDDGFIGVYKNFTMISKLDCTCSRDSYLFNTESGILLSDSGKLYLLNTK